MTIKENRSGISLSLVIDIGVKIKYAMRFLEPL